MDWIHKIWLVAAATQVVYYLLVFFRLNFLRTKISEGEWQPPVSVVICARNEAENLKRYLKVVLIQQYTQYEVIVVNDQSTDDTIDVLFDYYQRNRNLKIVNIATTETKDLPGKKYALSKGIAAASFDTIVVTDADCRPATTHWLSKLVTAYMDDTNVVLGHSPFERQTGWLNKLIRYENCITAMQYFGWAKLGMPYMGVGRNMSYKKEVFTTFDGFAKHKDLLSGDDDLLINKMADGRNTEICLDKDTFMYTVAQPTWSKWLAQKKRHLRSGFAYKLHHQLVLFLFALTKLLFYALLPVIFFTMLPKSVVVVIVVGVLAALLLSTISTYKKLGSADLWILSPLLDVFYSVYLVLIFFLILLQPKDQWK